jgi:UDP-N-acetylmuramoyl-L-alanyl-D-glutamate--2,6-diaminopimelate ligase
LKLGELTRDLAVLERRNGEPSLDIASVVSDSRRVKPGSLFVACPGPRQDGHLFLEEALKRGAKALVAEKFPSGFPLNGTAGLRVADSREALALLLNRYYRFPSKKLKLIGVTGTNGKTTIAFLLNFLLGRRIPSGYIGTLGHQSPTQRGPLSNTTPGSEELFSLLAKMAEEGVRAAALEVSSHALHQKRVEGLQFELALFTQLSPEHLDYHENLENYFQAKRLLFHRTPKPKRILINRDSPYGRRLLAENPKAKSLSLTDRADYSVEEIEASFEGSEFVLVTPDGKARFRTQLPLRHNVENAATVLAGLHLFGFDPAEFREALETFPGVPGRLERLEGNGFSVFVDYAHTPDAFEHILSEAKRLRPKRILTLFGCGGDRDPFKRPEMTRTAYHYSDFVILTSDNPRNEDPGEILRQMREGLPAGRPLPNVIEIPDRKEAIRELLAMAQPGDALFILGKGHEDYQILGTRKIHFDDREVVREILKKRHRAHRLAVNP